jgi:single-strand DNA-binding protein
MPNYAHVTLIGHLGRDPETKHTPAGDAVTEFSLATSRKRATGETTTWWRCAMWGKRGEVIARYLRKGDPILVVGEPHLRPWTDQEGAQRQSLEVDVKDFTFVGGKGEAPPAGAPASAPATRPQQHDFDDDIPF